MESVVSMAYLHSTKCYHFFQRALDQTKEIIRNNWYTQMPSYSTDNLKTGYTLWRNG